MKKVTEEQLERAFAESSRTDFGEMEDGKAWSLDNYWIDFRKMAEILNAVIEVSK
jgi:hypothetical protein